MLHKIQHAHSGGVLHGARPGWLTSVLDQGGWLLLYPGHLTLMNEPVPIVQEAG